MKNFEEVLLSKFSLEKVLDKSGNSEFFLIFFCFFFSLLKAIRLFGMGILFSMVIFLLFSIDSSILPT